MPNAARPLNARKRWRGDGRFAIFMRLAGSGLEPSYGVKPMTGSGGRRPGIAPEQTRAAPETRKVRMRNRPR